jgi:hypothetical protein
MHTVTDFPLFVGNKTAASTPGWKCSLFVDTCLNCLEEIDQCQNIDYCHKWETQTLKVLKSTTRKQLENMEIEQDSMEVGRRRHGNRSSGK